MSIICRNCGWENVDDAKFCVNDGAYLEFVGEHVEDEIETPPPRLDEPEEQPGIIQRVKSAIVGDGTESGADLPAPPTSVPNAGTETEAHADVPAAPLRAAAASPPAERPEPLSQQPGPTRPTEEAPAPPKKPPAGDAPQKFRPGDDVICTHCGWGNRSSQNFCRSCGTTLAEATPVHVPWWRRIFRRKRAPVAAGDHSSVKPKRRGRLGRLFRGAALLLTVGLAVAFIGPWRSNVTDGFGDVRRRYLPRYDNVSATGATLNTAPSIELVDGVADNWARMSSQQEAVIVVTFAEPTDLAKVLITSGANSAQEFQQFARPEDLRLDAVTDDGTTRRKEVNLDDERPAQTVDFDAPGITSLQITVSKFYPATGNPTADAAISELEFRKKG